MNASARRATRNMGYRDGKAGKPPFLEDREYLASWKRGAQERARLQGAKAGRR